MTALVVDPEPRPVGRISLHYGEAVKHRDSTTQGRAAFELRVLGPLEVWENGERRPLPRSKKTRALLAYLAVTARPHRRERLSALLWDVTDDPRGALRWSLSRVRAVFGEGAERIEADREQVAFASSGVGIDAHELSRAVRGGLRDQTTEALERLAALPRGAFLEGLDLPDFADFSAWCIAEREQHREYHASVLAELTGRLMADPMRALPFARTLAQTDGFDVGAQTRLFELLSAVGKMDEARQRFESTRRMFKEVGAAGLFQLEQSWKDIALKARTTPSRSAVAPARPSDVPRAPAASSEVERAPSLSPFVGRRTELDRLGAVLESSRSSRGPRVAVVTGEPGAGKSRLSDRIVARAQSAGFDVLGGRAYEAESSRPYGPWVDALSVELGDLLEGAPKDGALTKEALYGAVVDRLGKPGGDSVGTVLVLDDVQWLDSDSAELLHFVVRRYERGPLFVLLLARSGELGDNAAVVRTLRSLRREGAVEELELEPLGLEDIASLVGSRDEAELAALYAASAGNPLYAIELSRVAIAGAGRAPATILELIRERVERLPPHAADVLRWGAVLGHAIDVRRLEALSSLGLDELVDALERLEQSALLRIDATRGDRRYVFSHDIVREAVYGELSHPRRRLMHRKVALLLEPSTSDAAVATEVAHHAGLSGEALLGVRACGVAGAQSLRVFALNDAESLARRGLRLAERLEGAERIEATLDLLHLQYSARNPDRQEAAARVRQLAEQALDYGLTRAARLGFQMLSFLRWESSSMADAHANIMQAERVSRSADPDERSVALAQAAKCLVLLERNLSQAEAFVMEADALTSRSGRASSAVAFATGMIAAHRGDFEQAARGFEEAMQLAREHGERLAEYIAVEHAVMLAIDRGEAHAAVDLARRCAELGERVRAGEGAEAPAGRALLALVRVRDEPQAAEALDAALTALRGVDAKYELSYLLTRWAAHALEAKDVEVAEQRALDALEVARAVRRPSEIALARAVLAECAAARGDGEARAAQLAELSALPRGDLSFAARRRVETVLGAADV